MKGIAKGAAEDFVGNLVDAFGDSVQSVILSGPAALPEASSGASGEFVVVMSDTSPVLLARVANMVPKWRKRGIAVPLFLTRVYIKESLDTFPLEFMHLARSYRVLRGEDVFAGLTFSAADVRLQCERELKGKLLHLRAEFLDRNTDLSGLTKLAADSLEAFTPVFAGALFLKERAVPAEIGALVSAVAEAYGIPGETFAEVAEIAGGAKKLHRDVVTTLFDRYVTSLTALAEAINNLRVSETAS